MRRVREWSLGGMAWVIAGVSAVFLGTSGDYSVPRLVTDDPSLPTVSIAGVQLHVRVAVGPDGAQTIIVLHGGPGGDFRPLLALDTLSDHYRVVCYDQRGAGLSARVTAHMLTLEAHLSRAAYWREAILTEFRAQHVDGPDGAAQHDYLIGHMVGVLTYHAENPHLCGEGYAVPNWRFGGLSSDTWDTARKTELDWIGADAKHFEGHILLMAGSCNDWIGAKVQEQHLKLFTDARLLIIPQAGHDVIWENPQAARDAIRALSVAQGYAL